MRRKHASAKGVPKGVYVVRAKGRVYRYAWRGGPRLFMEPGTPEFDREYQNAFREERVESGSLKALIDRFRTSGEFREFSPRHQRDLSIYLKTIEERFGYAQAEAFEDKRMRGKIKRWRDTFASTPRKADLIIEAFRRLLSFGVDNGDLINNVARGIKPLSRTSRAHIVWTAEEYAAVLDHANHATARAIRFIRLTGLRREDACRIGKSADKGSHLEWTTGKGQGRRIAVIPILPELRALLDNAPPTSATTILTNLKRLPWTPDGLSTQIDRARKKAGVKKTIHDLRGTFATDLILAGFSDLETAEILAWSEDDIRKIRRAYVDREAIIRNAVDRMKNKP